MSLETSFEKFCTTTEHRKFSENDVKEVSVPQFLKRAFRAVNGSGWSACVSDFRKMLEAMVERRSSAAISKDLIITVLRSSHY